MDIRTAEDKTATLELLLNEARIEANELRTRIERYRRIIASTRLVMGHELKKPATAISGYLELACEDVEKAGLDAAVREECIDTPVIPLVEESKALLDVGASLELIEDLRKLVVGHPESRRMSERVALAARGRSGSQVKEAS